MHLSHSWRGIHSGVKFLYWPKVMNDHNPFKDIWSSMNSKVEVELNEIDLHVSWENTRIDFDNFHDMYEDLPNNLQSIITAAGGFFHE